MNGAARALSFARKLTTQFHTTLTPHSISAPRLLYARSALQARHYASKTTKHKNLKKSDVDADDFVKPVKRAAILSSDLVPGSEQVLLDEDQVEYDKIAGKMKAAVEWYRKEVAGMETRGSGRMTPDLLNPVRVTMHGSDVPMRLNEVATVGVREGTTLIVTVFDEGTLKHVEKALYAAKLPHVVPQRLDSRTIKIPLPKPTVEARTELAMSAAKQAEETRVQLRKLEQAGVKKGNYGKRSRELEEFRKLLDKHLKEVDQIVTDMKKAMGVK